MTDDEHPGRQIPPEPAEPPPAEDDSAERAYRALLEYERLAEGRIWPASNSGS